MINKFKNVMTWNKSQAQEAQKISSMIIMPKMQQLGITYSICTKSKVRTTWEKPEEKMHYLQKIKDKEYSPLLIRNHTSKKRVEWNI